MNEDYALWLSGVLCILLAVARLALAIFDGHHGNAEGLVLGSITAVALATIGSMVIWFLRWDQQRATEPAFRDRREP